MAKNHSNTTLYYFSYRLHHLAERPLQNSLRLYCIEGATSLALNPTIVLTFQRIIWRTMRMRASISRLLNFCFPQLAIYITVLLNLTSPIPKSKAAARNATRNAGEILMLTDHKTSSYPSSTMCWAYIGCQHSIWQKVRRNDVSSSVGTWLIPIFMRPGWNLSNNVERKTNAKYDIYNSIWRLNCPL